MIPSLMSPPSDARDTSTPERLANRCSPRAPITAYNPLAASITYAASKQSYFTARFLVDRDRVYDAYRAYAYFRWVDDELDRGDSERERRLAFVRRQRTLVERLYTGEWPYDLCAEERILAELVLLDTEERSGLQSYIRNMMAVMEFDANRRGRLISERELDTYTKLLATAVTDALHYFIGHMDAPPASALRYQAAMGAHIAHMLRDTHEDLAAGYYNAPREMLARSGISPRDVERAPYRAWARERVRQARACFKDGAAYLSQVKSLRCRLAGYAYMERFTGALDAIERDDYRLRPSYSKVEGVTHGMRMAASVGWRALLGGNA